MSVRALLLLLTCACGATAGGGGASDAGPVDFTIGSIAFHASSGAVVQKSGMLSFYLSDQPDACAALKAVPVMTATTFMLQIAPPADGGTHALVVAPKPAPAAGEATGGITVATGGVKKGGADAANGSVAWTASADGVTITALDVGFAGTADRLATHGLVLPACSP